MFKDHPLIAVLGMLGAVGLGSITLSSHFTAEPLRDRIESQKDQLDSQREMINRQNEEITRLKEQLSQSQRSYTQDPSPSAPASLPVHTAPSGTAEDATQEFSAIADAQPVLRQSYEGFMVEVVNSVAVGTSVTINFTITNTNPQDKKLMIAGSDGGNNRFLGYYSSMFADGIEYVASQSSIAGGRGYLIVPGGGQMVRATVKFDGIPSDLDRVDQLRLRVSTGGTYPSHRMPFGPLRLSR